MQLPEWDRDHPVFLHHLPLSDLQAMTRSFLVLLFSFGIGLNSQEPLPSFVRWRSSGPVAGEVFYGPKFFIDPNSKGVFLESANSRQARVDFLPFPPIPSDAPMAQEARLVFFNQKFYRSVGRAIYQYDPHQMKWVHYLDSQAYFSGFIPTATGEVLLAGTWEEAPGGKRKHRAVVEWCDGSASRTLIPVPEGTPGQQWSWWANGCEDVEFREFQDAILIQGRFTGSLHIYSYDQRGCVRLPTPWQSIDFQEIPEYLAKRAQHANLDVTWADGRKTVRNVILPPAPRTLDLLPLEGLRVVAVATRPIASPQEGSTTESLKRSVPFQMEPPASSDSLEAWELSLATREWSRFPLPQGLSAPIWIEGGRPVSWKDSRLARGRGAVKPAKELPHSAGPSKGAESRPPLR